MRLQKRAAFSLLERTSDTTYVYLYETEKKNFSIYFIGKDTPFPSEKFLYTAVLAHFSPKRFQMNRG